MRKLLPIFILALLAGSTATLFGQAKKYVIFEHFTQASCAPCAQQNPFMQATLDANVGRVHHIAYHTSWPGVDPMNTYNASQVADRVSFYGVSGVPDVVGCGNKYRGSPSGVTQTLVDNLASDPAPVRIILTESSNGTMRTVKVKVYTVATVGTGTYKIRVAVLEKLVDYATPPGSNGEKNFPDVFRKMLPNSSGETYTPAPVGDSVTFTYTYNLDLAVWDTTQIYTCAFIQKDGTKEIINSGSSIDPKFEFVPIDANFKKGYAGDVVQFHYKVYNLGAAAENFRFKLNRVDSASWSSNFIVNGTTINDSTDLSMPGYTTWDLVVNVTIGDVACLGTYTMTMKSLDNTEFAPVSLRSNVIYGVYELIINNDGGWGSGSSMSAAYFQQKYIDGLKYAGSEGFGVTDLTTFKKGYYNNCLDLVTNYYFNVSWTFPSFTDESVAIFGAELDAGKNLFVAGQDVGWDTWDLTNGGNGTSQTQAFFTNYLGAQWLADGGSANNQFIANTADPIFGTVPTSPVTNPYGGSYFYPDEINATGNGTNIFFYNTSGSKKGGVRATNGTWKTVYLGIGPEMMSNQTARNELIKTAHVWFGGSPWTGIKPSESPVSNLMSQNFPNPSNTQTTILIKTSADHLSLRVMDMTGRILIHETLSKGQNAITLNTSNLSQGIYFYQLLENGKVLESRKMQVN